MDEPTSSLTLNEVADLFHLVRRLRDEGTAIIFISHRIEELFELAGRVTVLRDGYYIGTRVMGEVARDDLIRMMVGLVGAGRTEVARVIFGIDPATGGTVRINGQERRITSPGQAIRLGLAYVPEDRQMEVRASHVMQKIRELSGGNQQKVLLGQPTIFNKDNIDKFNF